MNQFINLLNQSLNLMNHFINLLNQLLNLMNEFINLSNQLLNLMNQFINVLMDSVGLGIDWRTPDAECLAASSSASQSVHCGSSAIGQDVGQFDVFIRPALRLFIYFTKISLGCMNLHEFGRDNDENVAVPVGYQMLFIIRCSLFVFVCFSVANSLFIECRKLH